MLCDERVIPDGYRLKNITPLFSNESVPEAITREHLLKSPQWGIIKVKSGTLVFRESERAITLGAGEQHVIVPDVSHFVELIGPISFQLEFYRGE